MDNKKLKKKLDEIVEKRKNCIQLTTEETIFANEFYDKLHVAKFGNKKLEVKTGDEIRKASSFEGTPPKNRGFVGGYDRKADVERTELGRDGRNTAGEPTRKDAEYFSVEGKETPTEDTSGAIKADYRTEEYADTDGKKYVPQYEETRLANQIEGQHQYDNSIRVKDIVFKSVRHLGQVIKIVGHVLKTYKDGKAALVKWATGTMSHEVATDLTVLKAVHTKTHKEEDKVVSPPVRKHSSVEKLAQALHRAKTHFGKSHMGGFASVRRPGPIPPTKVPGGMPSAKVPSRYPHKAEKTEDVEKVGISGVIRAARRIGRRAVTKPETAIAVGGGIAGGTAAAAGLKYASRKKLLEVGPRNVVGKGEKPPSDWLDRCVERVKESGGADEPYAVCTATYNKMKSLSPEDIQKDESGNEYIKLTAEDFAGICEPCVEKMNKQNIKFLKVYLGDFTQD